MHMEMVREAAGVLFTNDAGELLLRLRDDRPDLRFPNHWDLIGGGVEAGETNREAAIREVKEELGLDVTELTPIGRYQGTVPVAIFLARLNVPATTLELSEGQRVEFFSLVAAAQLALVPWMRLLLADVAQLRQ